MGKKPFALALLFLLCLSATRLVSQSSAKYWIFFTDKEGASEPALAQQSLERRAKLGIPTDEKDRPVSPPYLETLSTLGIPCRNASRWLNGASAWLTPEQVSAVLSLPFVRGVKPIPQVQVMYDETEWAADKNYDPGYTRSQVSMLGLDHLHSAGYYGRGVIISVMDNGFRNCEDNPFLSHLFAENRILATKDFVDGDNYPYDGGSHGAYVLSILAGFKYGEFEGSAPGATYILCRTENDAGEKHQEEDNWVAAMEFADSIGADIFSTSLGYLNGMQDTIVLGGDTIVDYSYSHLDGNTAIITVAADIAASRGILVVNAAGNNGVGKMNAPADGDSVLATGAVDSSRVCAGFSSQGPTYDDRLKPDVTAMGRGTVFVNTEYIVSAGNGTSFSCPMTSGLAACLLQTTPTSGGMKLFDAIVRSGDRYDNPDTLYGHGIPDGRRAFEIMNGVPFTNSTVAAEYTNGIFVFPTIIDDALYISLNSGDDSMTSVDFNIYDAAGRKVLTSAGTGLRFINQIRLDRNSFFSGLTSGAYTIKVFLTNDPSISYTGKFFIPN